MITNICTRPDNSGWKYDYEFVEYEFAEALEDGFGNDLTDLEDQAFWEAFKEVSVSVVLWAEVFFRRR